MKKLLILFAYSYPYSTHEPFLENETPLYKDYFDKVLLIIGRKRGELPTRQLPDPAIEVISDYTMSGDMRSILEAIPWMLTDRMFYKELKHLIFKEGFSVRKIYDLLVMALCANHRAMQAARWMKRHPEYKINTLYSYWLNIPAYSALRLKNRMNSPQLRVVSRCHGWDIYRERKKNRYLPYQKQIVQKLDFIAAASSDAKNYLENLYGKQSRISVHYLGARDVGYLNPSSNRDVFHLVSCARVVPIKRLVRIVDALVLITNRQIRWTHIGDGEGFDALKAYAMRKLSDNIHTNFIGRVPNASIYQIYKSTPFHAFISVSQSEGGAPVSICEAISFGIPAIVTAVGGHLDVIKNGENGFLLERDYEDEKLASLILHMADMEEAEYQKLRSSAHETYEQKFNSLSNNRSFIERVLL